MWLNKIKAIPERLRSMMRFTGTNAMFIAVLYLYILRAVLRLLLRIKLIGKVFELIRLPWAIRGMDRAMKLLDFDAKEKVSRVYLIELAFRNMKAKKNRAVVTIGGVAVGVGAIVFLVSLGYGLEKMVISKVARLDELKMADVTMGKAGTARMNEEMVEKIKTFSGVKEVIPWVSMVAKLRYNNSVMDIMTYGVDEKYLKASGVKFVKGEFKDKDKDYSYQKKEGEVSGVSQEIVWTQRGEKIDNGIVRFNVVEGKRPLVYQKCDEKSEIEGEVIRSEGGYVGERVWGSEYRSGDEVLVGRNVYLEENYSLWVMAKVPVWTVSESGLAVPRTDNLTQQKWIIGCLKKDDLVIDESSMAEFEAETLREYILGIGEVLGESDTASAAAEASPAAELFVETEVATDSSGVEWVELKKTGEDKNKLKEIDFDGEAVKEAFVSSGWLKMINIKPEEAVGKTVMVAYIIPDGMVDELKGRLQSKETEYKIAGIVEDETSNFYYFQIADAKRLGIKNYSQLKIVVDSRNGLAEVRKSIETIGFKTTSTVDTVAGIERIFKTLRMILGFLGTIALAVASLGMFNTMTVSLLERTREVGVMKAMGMLSNEVRELFLAESMIMGVGGGTMGILLGFLMGNILSIVLSSVSVVKGQGTINISYIPWFFVAFIMLVSFLVGVATGWYPSKRARAISALNALRYE